MATGSVAVPVVASSLVAGSAAASWTSSVGFAVAAAFAFDADRVDGFFLLLAMKRGSLDAAVRAVCRAGPRVRTLA